MAVAAEQNRSRRHEPRSENVQFIMLLLWLVVVRIRRVDEDVCARRRRRSKKKKKRVRCFEWDLCVCGCLRLQSLGTSGKSPFRWWNSWVLARLSRRASKDCCVLFFFFGVSGLKSLSLHTTGSTHRCQQSCTTRHIKHNRRLIHVFLRIYNGHGLHVQQFSSDSLPAFTLFVGSFFSARLRCVCTNPSKLANDDQARYTYSLHKTTTNQNRFDSIEANWGRFGTKNVQHD